MEITHSLADLIHGNFGLPPISYLGLLIRAKPRAKSIWSLIILRGNCLQEEAMLIFVVGVGGGEIT